MSDVLLFRNELGNLRVLRDNVGASFLNLKDASIGLGYTQLKHDKLYIRKDLVSNICNTLGVSAFLSDWEGLQPSASSDFDILWISQGDFFDLAMESRAGNARAFRKWVTREVLPALVNNGAYIMDNATEEQIDNAARFHPRRLAATFSACSYEDFRKVYGEFKAHYAHKVSSEKYDLLQKVISGVRKKYDDSDDFVVKHGCLAILDELHADETWHNNYRHGAEKRVKTNEIKKLRAELEETKKQLPPQREEYHMVPYHGFSNNLCITTSLGARERQRPI
jgi:prophage antirepressor-like protein